MKLMDFYRKEFMEAALRIPGEWVEDPACRNGYRWVNFGKPFKGSFQISKFGQEAPFLLCTVILNEKVPASSVIDQINLTSAPHTLSVHYYKESMILCSELSVDRLHEPIYQYVLRIRAELIELADSVVHLKEKRVRG